MVPTIQYMKTFASFTLTTRASCPQSKELHQPPKLLESPGFLLEFQSFTFTTQFRHQQRYYFYYLTRLSSASGAQVFYSHSKKVEFEKVHHSSTMIAP